MDFQHFPPGVGAGIAFGGVEPFGVELGQLLGGGQIRRLAGLAAGLVVLSPLGPLQALLRRRRQFRRAHVGQRQAVLETRPDRHQGLAREDTVAEDLALGRFGKELDADLGPAVVDQFQDVGLFGVLAGGLDNDVHWPAVGQQADVLVVALIETQFVEQLVGGVGVVFGPLEAVIFIEQRAVGQGRVVLFEP